ncbi:hypothetical protein FEAC_03880 [Ferrimicrobium acidiphilum DSM 19497]|uniref:Uncharacterized protein n=1 Tax=Ferrimicrobium acidiphilum DSM 19497 TaxID=1121877 RepID=A0A0D8FWH9_9ACTN|nr:hypothetical protein FEAC_03880 [Ferrimicrobium acidiphilum DSM 19497]
MLVASPLDPLALQVNHIAFAVLGRHLKTIGPFGPIAVAPIIRVSVTMARSTYLAILVPDSARSDVIRGATMHISRDLRYLHRWWCIEISSAQSLNVGLKAFSVQVFPLLVVACW